MIAFSQFKFGVAVGILLFAVFDDARQKSRRRHPAAARDRFEIAPWLNDATPEDPDRGPARILDFRFRSL